ncbi:restriction endonuclease subunit S [Flavobacterium sp. ZT3R17]|uniref:restriction endonuclease subunit S n=1 Tax=Flavobacterium cryoconiti TaxID=3398736 RepID=UPI003A897B34
MRFPEFDGEWEVKKLGEVASNKSGKYNPINATDSIKCIELEHLATETGQLLGYTDGSKSGSIKNVFNEGDVLFGKLRPYLKKYLQAPFDGVCSSEIWVLKGKNISNDFLYRIVQTNSFIDLANQSSGSKMPRADWNVVENGFFSFPSLTEQQKIASFLSLIDERIQTQSKIIENLKTLIKATSEKLFTQKIRFKDDNGSDFPDWEVKSLGEICEKKSSNISANKIEDNFGEYIIYGASGVLKKVDFYEEKNDYISIVKDGAGVGRLFYCKGKSSVLGTMDIIKPLANTNTYFLFYLLSNIDFTKYVTGSTIPHIYFKDYKNENFGIPCTEEQTKIATFLSQIDEKIEIEKQLLIEYENQKKYLLQNLFI